MSDTPNESVNGQRMKPLGRGSYPSDHRRTGWAGLPVNITRIVEGMTGPFDVYMTWAAWTASGLDNVRWNEVRDVCGEFNLAAIHYAPNPFFRFRPARTSVALEAVFGPNGRGGACVRLALPGEPAWFTPLFRPNRVVVCDCASRLLDSADLCAVVGRHLAGDWGSVGDDFCRAEDDNFRLGREVSSHLDSLSRLAVSAIVTTDQTRSRTTVEAWSC